MQKKTCMAISILVIFVAIFISGTASAITGITSSLTQNLNGTPCLIINQGDSFNITLTAENPVGTITWIINGATGDSNGGNTSLISGEVTLSPSTGNSTTVSGTLSAQSYSLAVMAYDNSDTVNTTAGYSFGVLDSAYYSNIGNPVPAPITSQDTTAELNQAIIAPVVLSDEVIARLASNISVDPSEIILLTSADFALSEPPEPTQAMRQEVSRQNAQLVAKLNTITVSKDGYYVFMVTVSDDLVGTPVKNLRLYTAEESDFNGASVHAAFPFMPIFNGISGAAEFSNFLGIELDTLPKQFLAVLFFSAGKSITTYLAKMILMFLMGGCNAGFGLGIVCVAAIGIVGVKYFRRR